MIKNYILIIISVLLFNCSNLSNKKLVEVEGNWWYCNENGLYTELHIKDSIWELCYDAELIGFPYLYKFINDTLTLYDFSNILIAKATIAFINEDSISVEFLKEYQENKNFTLTRIKEKVLLGEDLLRSKDSLKILEYIDSFNNRKSKSPCIETEKEIIPIPKEFE